MPVLSPIAVLPGDASHADHARLVVERRVEEPSEWLAARFDRTQFVVERPPPNSEVNTVTLRNGSTFGNGFRPLVEIDTKRMA